MSFVGKLGALRACACAMGFALAGSASAAVFVNEIHYDNIGGDTGEAIEVVATAGEDLTQYRLVLYNGSAASLMSYADNVLPAGSMVTCGASVRIATFNYPANGIQNGNPDGFALVQGAAPGGTVIQFLSYEGTFTPVNGPASGMPSTDIGVFELDTTTAAGNSLQLSGNGSSYLQFTWQIPAAQTFGACNTGQTFVGGGDVAPTVTSTVPTDSASNVALNSNITINFSEAVTVNGAWFALNCPVSGTGATFSGGPSTYTINPNNDFVSDENCGVTIFAAQVTDQDGTPDNMAVNYAFSFTAALDVPPTVLATSPANGVSNVALASNLGITFSEPVTVSSTWYSITCVNSGVHAATVSGGPSAYTLDPTVNFGTNELCTVALMQGLITDQDGVPQNMAAPYSFSFTTSAGIGAYYSTVDATNQTTLRATLHPLIDDHVSFSYSDAWGILEQADQDPLNSGRILDVYLNHSYLEVVDRSGGTGPQFYNREHTWPNSHGFNDATNSAPYTDTHMLYLSASHYNSDRGNRPYAACTGVRAENPTELYNGQGGGTVVYPGNSNWQCGSDNGTGSYEVWGFRRGDMARAILYMDIRYEGGTGPTGVEPDLIATDNRNLITITGNGVVAATGHMGQLCQLIQWHQQDPPDAYEQMRNEIIFSYQTNRNPFIDHPEWVVCLYRNDCAFDRVFAGDFEGPIVCAP